MFKNFDLFQTWRKTQFIGVEILSRVKVKKETFVFSGENPERTYDLD